MSEDKKQLNIVGAWFEFAQLRKELEERVKGLEITGFNLQYGTKTEAEFRQRLREARLLFEKIEDLIGPPTTAPQNVT